MIINLVNKDLRVVFELAKTVITLKDCKKIHLTWIPKKE